MHDSTRGHFRTELRLSDQRTHVSLLPMAILSLHYLIPCFLFYIKCLIHWSNFDHLWLFSCRLCERNFDISVYVRKFGLSSALYNFKPSFKTPEVFYHRHLKLYQSQDSFSWLIIYLVFFKKKKDPLRDKEKKEKEK